MLMNFDPHDRLRATLTDKYRYNALLHLVSVDHRLQIAVGPVAVWQENCVHIHNHHNHQHCQVSQVLLLFWLGTHKVAS